MEPLIQMMLYDWVVAGVASEMFACCSLIFRCLIDIFWNCYWISHVTEFVVCHWFWVDGQWLFLVPIKGGRDYITSQKAIYKWYISDIYIYILPIGGLYATYHPLQEPEKSIEMVFSSGFIDPQIQSQSPRSSIEVFVQPAWKVNKNRLANRNGESPKLSNMDIHGHWLYVPGSKLPLFPYNRGWSSTQ